MMTDIIKSESGKEVNFLAIKDFAKVSIGEFVHKSKQNPSGKYPVYNGGTGNTGFYDEYNRTANKIIVSARGANAGYVNRVFVDFWSGNSCYSIDVIDENVDWNYIYYCLKNGEVKLLGEQQKGGIPAVSKKQVEQFKIPLPPLPIQQEIVRILDTFTNLTAELTAELTARRKQYEYYRDELLTFGEDVPVTTFGEVSMIFRGASPRPIKDYITDDIDGINWIKIGDVRPGTKYITDTAEKITKEGAKKSRFVYKGDFILSNSMSFGRPYIIKKTGCIHDGWLSISEFEEHYSTDFLYHLLSSHKYQSIMKRKASFGGAVQNLNADIVKSLELPIISLNEQRRIVSMLDKFDVICSDICAGLPAEIKARQRQYEYYRDKLLNFKELHNKED